MSLEQYKNEMITAKESRPELVELTSTSKASIWRNMLFIFAYITDLISQMLNQHSSEMDEKIKTQKTHRLEWIQMQFLNFQYGFDLLPESDLFDNTGATDEDIEISKEIKYCAVSKADDKSGVIIKIATEVDGELWRMPDDKMEAVAAWWDEAGGCGVDYTIINYLPDLLKLNIRIFRDPLVLDANGMVRGVVNGGTYPVKTALQEFMKELPFNGELRLQELANKLESVQGVKLVQIDHAQSSWIDPALNGYGDYITIDVRTIPASGYFKLTLDQDPEYDNNLTSIQYVV